jgi:ribonuclease P protein component
MDTVSGHFDTDLSVSRRYLFPKSRHLRSPLDFARVYEPKQRAGDEHLLIFGAPRPDGGPTRVGFSISKKNGNSPQRHRIRRLLREAFRLSQHEIPDGLDLILIPRPGSGSTLVDYEQSLVRLSQKLHRRLCA